MFIQLYTELCKYAINIDKGNMEREEVQRDKDEYNKRRLAMSKTCVRMAFMLKEYDFRMSRICGLTAFSLDPTTDNLNLVNKLYWTIKNVSAASQNSKINIATLYEIERLLGQIRPEILNPEYSWKQLIPICKKYKQDFQIAKNGLMVKKEFASDNASSLSSSLAFTGTKQTTPLPNMLSVVNSDKNATTFIDTGQKKGRKPKEHEIPKDIQKAHLTKLLKQKNLSNEEIEKVLSKEFPRNVSQDFSVAPSLDVKELGKTINDLKKSIDLETRYRELLKHNLSTIQQPRKRNETSVNSSSAVQREHVSRQEQFRQQQQMLHSKSSSVHRQHSAPGGSQAQGPILHRQLSVGSPQPPHAHSHHRQQQVSQMAAFGGSPPPAHSTSPRLSSPTGFQSPLSPPGYRPHSASPTILNSRKSNALSQMQTSHNRSNTVNQLCNKVQGEIQQQSSRHTKSMKSINILRPPGSSTLECAKIAQQVAELHEQQRAERLEKARLQGEIDCKKAALNSRNILSRSQISDLLSLTFQGNKAQKVPEGQKNLIASLQGTDISSGKSYLKKKIERSVSLSSVRNVTTPQHVQRSSESVQSSAVAGIQSPTYNTLTQSSLKSPSTARSHSMEGVQGSKTSTESNVLVAGEQGWDASRGILKQKYYYKAPTSKDGTGKGSSGDSSLTFKPVYQMIVPKELTKPDRQEDLVKTVKNMMKQQQKSATSSSQVTASTPAIVRVQNNSQPIKEQKTNVSHQLQMNSGQKQVLAASMMQNNTQAMNNQLNVLSGVAVSSQNLVEDGLLNLNTLAAASVSVLGQTSDHQQIVCSVQQPAQAGQHQQIFASAQLAPQTMYTPVQSVQQVVQQPETILATPLYTVPAPMIAEPVLSQQVPGIQQQVDIGLQQPMLQQIITVQNQPLAINSSPQFVNVPSQQPGFQVAAVEQVTNFSGVAQPMTSEITPLISTGISGGFTNSVLDGLALSMSNAISQAVSGEITQSVSNLPSGTLSSASVRPMTHNQFISAPELSPAVFQQILTSLKKGGSCTKAEIVKQPNIVGQTSSPMIRCPQNSVKKFDKDNNKQIHVNQNDGAMKHGVNEARQKILELRKQYGQAGVPQTDLPNIAPVATSQVVPPTLNSTVASPKKTSGLLERLMSDDNELKKLKVSIPQFLPPSQPNTVTSLSGVSCLQQVVPDLPDLGAKEFQIDSLLALDNENSNVGENTLQNDQFTQQNVATSGPFETKRTDGLVGESRLKNKVSDGEIRLQSETTLNVSSTSNTNLLKAPQTDSRQESLPVSQSTYYNANRLGKERENREVKDRENKDMKKHSQEEKPPDSIQKGMKATCSNCDLSFPTEQHLHEHNQISNCSLKWQCTYCKMTFKCADILKSHEKNYCLKAPSAMVKCYNCGVYFHSHEQLKAHLNPKTCVPQTVVHGKQSSELIVCGICTHKFDSMNSIKEHVKIGCIKKDSSFNDSRLQDYDFSVVFKCTICDFMNFNENIAFKHVEMCKENNITAELTKLYKCNMCQEAFCHKEDGCRHVTRQCPKLKVTNSQRQIQGAYQRLKSSNTSNIDQNEKNVNLQENTLARRERDLEEENNGNHVEEASIQHTDCMTDLKVAVSKQKDIIGTAQNIKNEEKRENVANETLTINTQLTSVLKDRQEETDLKHTQNSSVHDVKPEVVMQQECKDGLGKKAPAILDDKLDLTVQLQKEQRISAENRFFAEFNEIEKRKQAIRMKKQKELERREKEREWRELVLLREHKSKVDKEKLKQKFHVEKQDKEQLIFENEKRKHMDNILGNATLQQKMKESIENKKKTQKSQSEKIKDGTVKILSILKVESKELKTQNTENQTNVKLEKMMDNSITVSQKSRHAAEAMKNKKKRKSLDEGDFVDEILPEEKRVLKEHVQMEEINTRRKDIFTKDISRDSSRNIKKKQRSPQDIRKMKGLRAKRLIKRQKFFIENFEMEPLRKDKLKKETEQTETNTNLLNLSRKNNGSAERLDVCKNKSKAHVKEEGKLEETNKKVKHLEHNNQEKYRHFCRFCDFKCNPESSKKINLVSHYIKSHKLGFRQVNYSYYCNFCNKKFPSTQTLQVKEHVFKCHGEAVLKRAASGNYNRKVQQASKIVKFSPIKTRFNSRLSGRAVQTNKHLRALALREKCAEKLRIIALTRKNAIVDYGEEGFIQSGSNNSTDTESREERIADVSAKIASLSKEARSTDSYSATGNKDGRRIAPRLARQMIKEKKSRGNSLRESDIKISEVDDSSDSQILTRSRSNSASSSRSSLIASAKKRKAAIAISTRSSKGSRSQFGRSNKLQLTRSGRVIKRPEIDYDKLTESSGLGSGEDTCNSDIEDSEIRRRKSTRVRRLSERGKLLRDAVSETDESSTEEIKPRTTRLSLSRGQKVIEGIECDSESTDKEEKKRNAKRIKTEKNTEGISNRESENLTKSHNKNTLVKVERINTRQNSKNVKESDSETESNYTDIENTVMLLGLKNMEKTAEGSAESDSESTSVDDFRKRKYKLRKRSSDKKYIEPDTSEEEKTSKDSFKQTNDNGCSVFETSSDKPKVVLIGAEDDDDLNVDYGIDKQMSDECPNLVTHESSQNLMKSSECISGKKEADEFAEEECTTVDTKVMTVLVNPEDEFADLKTALEKPYQTESELNSELSNEGECTKSFAMPITVMDEDEFKFLKDSEISVGTYSEKTKENICSIPSASKKAAFDSEFIKYAETEKSEDESECETDMSDQDKEKKIHKKFDVIVEKELDKGLSLEVPPLLEDVPVLPPRNVVLSIKNDTDTDQDDSQERILSNEQEHSKEIEGINAFADSSDSEEISTAKSKPMLKAARVVIEDISVVRKALEAENTEKKLREECEASKCTVRIGRLSKKEIEKLSSSTKGNSKEELDVIVIEESDSEGTDEITSVRFNNRDLRQEKQSEEKIQKSHRALKKTSHAEVHQYETLIKDIVLDVSVINQLLENENIEADARFTAQPEVDVINQKVSTRIKDGSEERSECVQIVLENDSLPDSVLAVDAQCDTSNQEDTSTAVKSNNVIILISETDDDISQSNPQSEKEKFEKERVIEKEVEDEVWIENAESYAETPMKCESSVISPCKKKDNASDELNLILPNTTVSVESITNVTNDRNHESSHCLKKIILGANAQISDTTSKTKTYGNSGNSTVTSNLSLRDAETDRNISEIVSDASKIAEENSDIVSDASKIAEENDVTKSFEKLEADIVSDATKISVENSVNKICEKLEDEKNIILTAALNKKESRIASLEAGILGDRYLSTSSSVNNERAAESLNENCENFELDRKDDVYVSVPNNLSESCVLAENRQSIKDNDNLQCKLQLESVGTNKDIAGSGVNIDKLNNDDSGSDFEERLNELSSVEIDPQTPEECNANNAQGGEEEIGEVVGEDSKNKKLLAFGSCKVVDKLIETPMQESIVEKKNKNEPAIELPDKSDTRLNIETYETYKESNTDEIFKIHHASQDSLGTKTLIKNNTDEVVEKNEPCSLSLLGTEGNDQIFVHTNVLEKTENVEHAVTVDRREVFSSSSGKKLISQSGKSNKTQEKEYLSTKEDTDLIAGTLVSCTSSELKRLQISGDDGKTETDVRNKEIDETAALVLVEIQENRTEQPNIQKDLDSIGFMKEQPVFAETEEELNVTTGAEGNKNTIENLKMKISIEPVLVNEDLPCDSSSAKSKYSEIGIEENNTLSLTDISVEIETKNENEVNNGLIPESDTITSQERSETTSYNASEEYTVDVDADMATETAINESSSQICENEKKVYDLSKEGLCEEDTEIITESSNMGLSQHDNILKSDTEKEKTGLIAEHKPRNENTNNTLIFTNTEATGWVAMDGAVLPTAVGKDSNDYGDRVTAKSSILLVESGVEKNVVLQQGTEKMKIAETSKDKIRTSESAENESAETIENSESSFEENASADVNDKLLETSRDDAGPISDISKTVKNTSLLAIQSYSDSDSDIELIDVGISYSDGSLGTGLSDSHSHSIQVIEQVIQDKVIQSNITDSRLNSVAENISSFTDKPDRPKKICEKGDKDTNYESEILQARCSKTNTKQPSVCVDNRIESVTIMKNTNGSKDFSRETPNENKEKAIGDGSSRETNIKEQDSSETYQSYSEILSNDETYLPECRNREAGINMLHTEKQTCCETDSTGTSSTVFSVSNRTKFVRNVLNDHDNSIVQENVSEKVKMDIDITGGSSRTVENVFLDSCGKQQSYVNHSSLHDDYTLEMVPAACVTNNGLKLCKADQDQILTCSKNSAGKTDIDIIPSFHQIQDEQVQKENSEINDGEHLVEENSSEMKSSSSNMFKENSVDSDNVKNTALPTADMSAEVNSVQSGILPVTLKDNGDIVKTNQREVEEEKEDGKEDESPYLIAYEQNKGETLGISEIKKGDEENVKNLKLGITRQGSTSSSSDISLISFPEYMTEQDEADNDKRDLLVESKSLSGTSVNIETGDSKSEINLDKFAVLQQVVPESVKDKAASLDSSKTCSIKILGVVEISPHSDESITSEIRDISKGDTRAYSDHEINFKRNEETEQIGKSSPTDSSDSLIEIPCVSNLDVNEMTKGDSEIVHATVELDSNKDINFDNEIDHVGDTAKQSLESDQARNKGQFESFSNQKDENKRDSEIKSKIDMRCKREGEETERGQYTVTYEDISTEIEAIDKQEKVVAADTSRKDDGQYQETASLDPMDKTEETCKETCSVETIVDVQHSHENAQQLETLVAEDKHDEITVKLGLNQQVTDIDTLVLKNDRTKKKTSEETGLKTAQDEKVYSSRVKSLDEVVRENEEKRKVFETPSPRRKGMIVGSTCVLKKPASPFIETKVTEKVKPKIGSLSHLGNQAGNRNEFGVNDGDFIQGTERSLLHIGNESDKGLHQSVRPSVNQRSQRKPVSSENGKLKKEKNQLFAENKGNVTVSGVRKKETHSCLRIPRSDRQQNSVKSEKKDPDNEIIEKKKNLCHIQTLEVDRSQKIPHGFHENTERFKQVANSDDYLKCIPHEVQNEDTTLQSIKDSGRERKMENPKTNDDKFISLSASSSCVKRLQGKEVSKKSADSSELKGTEMDSMTREKTSNGKISKGETVTGQVQLDNETDEEFRRRTETVRCARKRSAVKPYESDFNFEENENSKSIRDTKVKPSTAFWPSESENKIENFDTTSLYSNSSSGSSSNEGKSRVIARCARDFGKEDVVKQKVILQPQASALPAFTCSSPDKTTVSTMAVKIVKTFGASVQSTRHNPTEQNLLKYTVPPISTPIMTNKIKLLDKNVLSNTSLPPRIVKVATMQAVPNTSFSKTFKLASGNIDQTIRNLKGQGEIPKETIKEKVIRKPGTEREISVKIIVGNKLRDTEVSVHELSGENVVGDFESSMETMSNKTKALRALHKSDKPFKWENSPSPSKMLRSKTRENKSNFEEEKNMESTKSDKVCKRKLNIKNQKAAEKSSDHSKLEDNQRNLRDKKKIETEHLSKTVCSKDMLEKKQIPAEVRKTRKREQSSSEKDLRTRSRSGSKDKTKVSEEKNTIKQKDDVTGKNKKQDKEIIVLNKQTKGKVETKEESEKQSDTSLTDENVKSAMTLRHCSVEREEVSAIFQKRKAETGESEGNKTKYQKSSSEFEDGKEQHSSKTSNEELAAKICKLDGTSNSPEKGEMLKCAHTLNIPGCDNCDQRPMENKKIGKESSRPAVRQIIHKGRVFEIQRGCVTETDIQDFTSNSGSVVKETGTDDQVQTRSRRVVERRKRAHSPDSSFETSIKAKSGTVGMMDINKYISQTLRDIKRQRESNSNSKWTVKQKKRTRDPFPYSFKKANSKL